MGICWVTGIPFPEYQTWMLPVPDILNNIEILNFIVKIRVNILLTNADLGMENMFFQK